MDDQGTWPTPLPATGSSAQRDFDRQVMDEVKSDPQALRQIGGVKGNVLIVLVPVIALILLVAGWYLWRSTGSGVWLGVIAAVLVVATLIWVSRVKAVMNQAREVLGQAVVGSVGYGVGVVKEIRILDGQEDPTDTVASEATSETPAEDPDSDQNSDLSAVEVELNLSVSPVQGARFVASSRQRYATLDALRLEKGQHGPVRYLRKNPETTTAVETQLEPQAVEKIYRAAALN